MVDGCYGTIKAILWKERTDIRRGNRWLLFISLIGLISLISAIRLIRLIIFS